jgi:hypothetical protein
MGDPNAPYIKRIGYVIGANGQNGWFCVFDGSKLDENWRADTHQGLVMKMPNALEKTTRTQVEAYKLAFLSATTADSSYQWWK